MAIRPRVPGLRLSNSLRPGLDPRSQLWLLLLLPPLPRRRLVPLALLVPAQVGQSRDALLGLAAALGGDGGLRHSGQGRTPSWLRDDVQGQRGRAPNKGLEVHVLAIRHTLVHSLART